MISRFFSGASLLPRRASRSARIAAIRPERSVLFGIKSASRTGPVASRSTAATTAGSASALGTASFGLPTRFTSSSCSAMIFLISAWASMIASSMTSSGNSEASPSTIITASRVPATTTFSVLCSNSVRVGATTNRPSTRPIRIPATGPWNGEDEIDSAADAPMIPRKSVALLWSAERTDAMTWVSW